MIRFLSRADEKNLKGTTLLRLDFNTEDEWRMEAAIPTVKLLLRRADKIVIMSHRGRPIKFDKRFSLKRDAGNLAKLLRRKVIFLSPFSFPRARKEIARAPRGSVLLFENLRFLRGEEKNDPRLARALASLGDFYVNDAFAVCHRADASIDAITRFLPPFAGLELEKEIKFLSKILTKPRKPLIIILGGSKAHDKLGVLRYFRNIAGKFLIGGAAANTLLALRGVDVGKSPVDRDPTDLKRLKSIVRLPNIILPLDWRGNHGRILDIGPKTARHFAEEIKRAGTIVWSGPLGLIEEKRYARGTLAVAQAIAANRRAFSVAGGGETVMFLKKNHLDRKFSFISTGGGAMLDFLAGEKLPGIEALKRQRGTVKSA